jgi:hypothetical protein
MEQVLDHDNRELISAMERKINSEFSAGAMSEKYASLYLDHANKNALKL